MSEDEKTEAGETLHARMGQELAEVMADLPRRRLAVRAEVLAAISEEIDHLEATNPVRAETYVPMRTEDAGTVSNFELNFIRSAARSALPAINLAMSRGAGVPLEPADLPGQAHLNLQPPATAESLGDVP